MEITVVTSTKPIENEALQICRLFESGLSTLHLRKPKWTKDQVEALIKEIPSDFHKCIIVHGNYDLAVKYKLKGIHLHRKHRSPKLRNRVKRFLLKLKHPSLMITTTFNSLESLRENQQVFDYVFLSSVFNSHAYYHQNEEAGPNMLRSIINKTQCPVYALGGVTEEKLSLVKTAGFGGVGLSSLVWKNLDSQPERIYSIIKAA